MSCSRLVFTLPVGTKNPTNTREHHMARARRAKGQRQALELLWPGWTGPVLLAVRLTRVSPQLLDGGDNLPAALKSVRDEVAWQLRLDDASPLVRWLYAQTQGEPSVLVELSWGEDELIAAVRAQEAVAPPPPPVALAPRARPARTPRKARTATVKATKSEGKARSWADLVTPAYRRGGTP
ncbi:hypothetical protein [Myxococcus sp. AB025B]|uniref:hypothetical protein n=1 Tax=Myxococcus sp. AB025B TaxID=2562794 RepID=UPI0011424B35|nr:hypothetical protein [Myxococcus sp. AB025B]